MRLANCDLDLDPLKGELGDSEGDFLMPKSADEILTFHSLHERHDLIGDLLGEAHD